ncbi:nuclear transport factor 2 family protein [Streptomyces sp. NPDC091272]|uniref:nuclear transport factor 2 family protein n=1 Tax=Streptomyces sp. NPDC091272 TaxID=3365981 RepID=UPI0037F5B078
MAHHKDPLPDLRATVQAYWKAAGAHDWVTFDKTLADDVTYDLPQTGERIHGRSALSRFHRDYPAAWHAEVLRTVVQGYSAVTWLHVTVGLEELHAITFFTADPTTGLLTDITEFRPEPYEPPTGREHLVERY